MSHYKHRSEQEVQMVIERYAKEGPALIAKELGVKPARVKNIAFTLGIRTSFEALCDIRKASSKIRKPKAEKVAKQGRKAMPLLSSPVLDIAKPLMARDVGLTARELLNECRAAGINVNNIARTYSALSYQQENGRAFSRFRRCGRPPLPGSIERVFFATEDAAVASGLLESRAAVIAESGGTYLQRRADGERQRAVLIAQGKRSKPKPTPKAKAAKAKLLTPKPKPAKKKAMTVVIDKSKRLPDEAPVDFSRAKITVAPTRLGRFEVDPSTIPKFQYGAAA